MAFQKGEKVEICSKEPGFLGSYYTATVVSPLGKYAYLVQHENLEEEDKSGPLRDIVPFEDVRPMPPEHMVTATKFSFDDKVDAYQNDGWWAGKIRGKRGSNYDVRFTYSGEYKSFPMSKLRLHLDWNGKWVSSKGKRKRHKSS